MSASLKIELYTRPTTRAARQINGPSWRQDLNGAHLLMLAVLEEAVATYRKTLHSPDTRGQRLFEETAAWFADSDATWLFSFESICDALDLSAEAMRGQLAEWRGGWEPVKIRAAGGA